MGRKIFKMIADLLEFLLYLFSGIVIGTVAFISVWFIIVHVIKKLDK